MLSDLHTKRGRIGALAGSKLMSFCVPATPGGVRLAGTWIVTSKETMRPGAPLTEPTVIDGGVGKGVGVAVAVWVAVGMVREIAPFTPVAPGIAHWLPQPLFAGLLITTLLTVNGNGSRSSPRWGKLRA